MKLLIDMNLSLNDRMFALFTFASSIVFVSDGTDVSNVKLRRAYDALRISESSRDLDVLHKTASFYNKFSNKTGKRADIAALNDIGGVPRFEHMTTDQIVKKLVTSNAVAPIIDYLTGGGVR